MTMSSVPILLNSCARAATAAEARFRINRPIKPTRATRVIALDDSAAVSVRDAAREHWADARFLIANSSAPIVDGAAESSC
jgi:hypothetical protein